MFYILVITLVGLVLYLAVNPSTNPRIVEVGRVAYTYGLIVLLLCLCGGAHILVPFR